VDKILTLYDQVEQYIKRLGVDIDPYELLSGIYRYENDARDKRAPKLNKIKENPQLKLSAKYRQNSVFSFFTNDSIEKYDIYTGVNTEKNAEILAWNQHSYMDAWYGRQCNRINGTDGRQYAPFVRETRIYQFIPRLCR
ncbi:CD36-like protein, partial [Euroglyphus maynei]